MNTIDIDIDIDSINSAKGRGGGEREPAIMDVTIIDRRYEAERASWRRKCRIIEELMNGMEIPPNYIPELYMFMYPSTAALFLYPYAVVRVSGLRKSPSTTFFISQT